MSDLMRYKGVERGLQGVESLKSGDLCRVRFTRNNSFVLFDGLTLSVTRERDMMHMNVNYDSVAKIIYDWELA